MTTDVTKTLRKALKELQAEREKIDDQIAVIQRVLGADTRGPRRGARRPAKARKRARKMTAATRKAVSRRMKAYWAKRRAEAAKGKGAAK
jgi:Arc/MetJ-type ribon-helix-helix transcriptional regulator